MKPLETIYWLRLGLGIVAALICMSYVVATGSISKNLISNPSVEIATAGTVRPNYWFPSENGTEWSTDYARTGSRSIRIDVNNATAGWASKAVIVNEGYTYQIQGFFRGEATATQFSLTVKWFSDSEGVALIADNKIPIPVGNYSQWLPFGNVFAAPGGAKSCEIIFEAVNGSGSIYGDDFEVRQTESFTTFMNGTTLAILTYLGSYFVIKRRFLTRVEKPTKLITTGIGIYFIAWAVSWVLIYTVLAAALAA